MTDKPIDISFTPRDARLTRIAKFADIGAWIALVTNTLDVIARMVATNQTYQAYIFPPYSSLLNRLSIDPLYTLSYSIDLISVLFRGIVYFLVLKGLASGLRMIMETNLNTTHTIKGEDDG